MMIARFKAAFARALPHLPKQELGWRLHFVMGALSYTLAGTDALKLIAALNPRDADNDEMLLRRLAPFLIAGLKAPLPELDELDGEDAAQATTEPLMLTLIWILAVVVVFFALAYVNVAGWAWTLAVAAALAVAWIAHLLPALALLSPGRRAGPAGAPAQPGAAAAQADQRRRPRRVPQDAAADVADRARSDRSGHRVVGWRVVLRTPRLEQAARDTAAQAQCRRAAFHRP